MARSVVTQTTPRIVQHKLVTASTGAQSSVAATFASTPTPGNTIVVALTWFNQNFSSLTDTMGNVYTQVNTQQTANNNGSTDKIRLYYAKNIVSAGTFTVTFTPSAGVDGMNIDIYEIEALDPNTTLDTSAVNFGSGNLVTPLAITPTYANSLIFCLGNDDQRNDAVTQAGGYSLQDTQYDSSAHERLYVQTLIQSSPASTTASFQLGGTSNWSCILAVFRSYLRITAQ